MATQQSTLESAQLEGIVGTNSVEQNADNVQQNLNRRDIKRNTSNQIVSYPKPTDGDVEYGYHKVPALVTLFDKSTYNKTIPTLSNDLINTLPVVPLEIIQQKYISEAKIYSQGNANEAFGVAFEDIFSAKYELTNGAETFMGGRDKHSVNASYWADDGVSAGRGFTFTGYRKIYWDKEVYGPPLDDNGYRITKELIDSGKSIRLKATIGVANQHSSAVYLGLQFSRKRSPYNPYYNVAEQVALVQSDDYPYLSTTFDVENSDMVEGDLWQVHAYCGTVSANFFQYGKKSIFEVEVYDENNPAQFWNVGLTDPAGMPVSPANPSGKSTSTTTEAGSSGNEGSDDINTNTGSGNQEDSGDSQDGQGGNS